MAVLIERACTPVFSSKMNTDSDGNGRVDGFTSWYDAGITAVFSIDDNAQKIDITASTAVGTAAISTPIITVSPSTVYSFQVLSRGIVLAGTFKNNIYITWLDISDAVISQSTLSLQDPTTYWKLHRTENITPPSNAAKARIVLRARASTAGDAGTVWYRNVQFESANTCSTFTDLPRAADAQGLAIEPLSDTFSISFAVAPNFEYTNVPSGGAVWMRLSSLNSEIRILENNGGIIQAAQRIGSTWTYVELPAIQHARYKIIKIVLTRAGNNTYLYARLNNGTTISATATTQPSIAGFNTLSLNTVGLESNSFIESVTLYRNNVITTVEAANAIFDNMNAEMVVNGGFDNGSTAWNLKNGSVYENGRIKRIATEASGVAVEAARQEGTYSIKVLPNNTYKLKARLSGYVDGNNTPYLQPAFKDLLLYNSTVLGNVVKPTSDNQVVENIFTTDANTYYVQPLLGTYGTCTAYFDDVSLQLID
jgi:hypothetical protein